MSATIIVGDLHWGRLILARLIGAKQTSSTSPYRAGGFHLGGHLRSRCLYAVVDGDHLARDVSRASRIGCIPSMGALGAIGASVGGANVLRATARVTFWGALAMLSTAAIDKAFGTVV